MTRHLRPLLVSAVTYLLVITLLLAFAGWWEYVRLRDATQADARKLAALMADRFGRSATAADIILAEVETLAERALKAGEGLDGINWEKFRDAAKALPEPGSLWMTDAAGDLRLASTTRRTPSHNFRDREYFPYHIAGAESHLSGAVKGRITGLYHWLVSRRINGPDGRFSGVVLAALEDSGLKTIHTAVGLHDHSIASVLRDDGVLIMRYPISDDLIGFRAPRAALPGQDRRSGEMIGDPIDGDGDGHFIQAWQRMSDHPMLALVKVPTTVLWAQWRARLAIFGVVFLLSLVPLLILLRIGSRWLHEKIKARESLETLSLHQKKLLAEKEEILGRQKLFLDTVSHEFRTPLAIIDGTTQVLSRIDWADREAVLAKIAKIRRASRRMSGLIATCLADERVGADSQTAILQPVALADVLHTLTRQDPRMVISSAVQTTVLADRPLLEIALGNVLDNALKHAPSGDPVRIGVSATPNHARISVTNTGPGIDRGSLPHVFDRFYRSDAFNRSGLGLGLNIAKKIIHLHGGDIQAASEPEHETTFTVTLPLHRLEACQEA